MILPKKLNKEPLLEALFELRFICDFPASTILPGLLFSKLDGDKKIEQLPAVQIPLELRNSDPNLQFSPVSRLIWKNFHINIGDRSISISCQFPNYPGWFKFKESIEEIIEILINTNIITAVNRYSIKYVNLIPSDSIEEQVSFVNLDITIANRKVSKESFQFRIEIQEDNVVSVISVMSSAETLSPDGSTKKGIVVDIDTIALVNDEPLNTVLTNLEKTRLINKRIFFDCLTAQTIELLEPIYE